MICAYCDAETIEAFTTFRVNTEDLKLKIKDIPAYQCTRCKAAHYDFDVACKILNAAKVYPNKPASKRPDLISFKKLPRTKPLNLKRFKIKKDSASSVTVTVL